MSAEVASGATLADGGDEAVDHGGELLRFVIPSPSCGLFNQSDSHPHDRLRPDFAT